MGGVSEIMADCGWSWMVGVKLWLVVDGGSKIMAGRGWSRVVVTKLWLVVDGRGWLHELVMLRRNHTTKMPIVGYVISEFCCSVSKWKIYFPALMQLCGSFRRAPPKRKKSIIKLQK